LLTVTCVSPPSTSSMHGCRTRKPTPSCAGTATRMRSGSWIAGSAYCERRGPVHECGSIGPGGGSLEGMRRPC
jgi:hypothetical protein